MGWTAKILGQGRWGKVYSPQPLAVHESYARLVTFSNAGIMWM